MKIVRVSATPLNIPVTIDVVGMNKQTSLSLCLTEIETDTGLVGHGMTAITEEEIIAAAVREVAGTVMPRSRNDCSKVSPRPSGRLASIRYRS